MQIIMTSKSKTLPTLAFTMLKCQQKEWRKVHYVDGAKS